MTRNFQENPDRGLEVDYYKNREKLIEPYISGESRLRPNSGMEQDLLIQSIGTILDHTDEEVIAWLRASDMDAANWVRDIREVEAALKSNVIQETAPWLSILRDKILRFTLYCANADAGMDLKKGVNETEEMIKKHSPRTLSNSDESNDK